MTPERFRRLEALYDAAAAMDPGARTRFIDEQCLGDDELRHELLAAFHQTGSGFTGVLEQAAAVAMRAEDNWSGRRVGPYRIVRPLGSGGMGAVYLAVRDDDQFHKEVAIKTLKFELEGGSGISRFRHERQILAHLEHPNIARLLDGGATEHGTPYIVLEYVPGVPLAAWCDERQLTIDQRLRLFRQVCDAVQYAHQHLIVHRDIKPGNILVTADGLPKLLDFGIAKLLDTGEATNVHARTMTATGALLMTPDYASPEQVRGEAVSTATDIYSLGAVLYELLTGRRPHPLQNYDAIEIVRVVCDTEVQPPSLLGNRRLRGDLDNIVLKAMQKQPERRYSSVAELSEDIRRHLDGLPIAARRDTATYRALKFVRRHRLSVTAAVAVVAALAIGGALALREARIAERRFAQVRELANTFMFDFYDQVTPLAGSTAVRASIIETARKYLDGLSQEAGSDQDLVVELAQAYQRLGGVQGRTTTNLGQVEEARRSYQQALELYARLAVNADSPPELRRKMAAVLLDLGALEASAYREAAAEPIMRRMLELVGNDGDPATRKLRAIGQRSLGDVLRKQGKIAEALSLIDSARQTLVELQSTGVTDADLPGEISLTQERLARVKVLAGDLDGALAGFQELMRSSAPCDSDGPPGPSCRTLGYRLERVADVYAAVDRPNLREPEKAVPLYEQAIRIQERVAALDAHDRQARFDLAARYGKLGDAVWQSDPQRALDLYDRALAAAQSLASKEQFEILHGNYVLAITRPLIRLRRLNEARKALAETLDLSKTDAQSPYADRLGEIGARELVPDLLLAEGKRSEAREELLKIIADTEALRSTHPEDLTPIFEVSQSYRALASITDGPGRGQALLHSAAAWRAWQPATSFTKREEAKDLAAAQQ